MVDYPNIWRIDVSSYETYNSDACLATQKLASWSQARDQQTRMRSNVWSLNSY